MAAVDFFLKLDGIEGESKDDKHKGEIDLMSWSWGESQTGTFHGGGGGGAGKVQMQDFNFQMKVNKASPKLISACAKGDHIKEATLSVRKAGGEQQEYLKYVFKDVLVSSYQTGGHEGGDPIPTESISLNYSKMEMEYKEQKPDGTLGGAVGFKYDLKANKSY